MTSNRSHQAASDETFVRRADIFCIVLLIAKESHPKKAILSKPFEEMSTSEIGCQP